jgi:hypothetical protein
MTYSCRFEYLAQQVAVVEGDVLADNGACDRRAVWATSIHLARDGQDVDTTTRLCEHHDQQVRSWPALIDEPERLLLPH